jgi:hypothetical protein
VFGLGGILFVVFLRRVEMVWLLSGARREGMDRLHEVSILDVCGNISTPSLDAVIGMFLLFENFRKQRAKPLLNGFRDVCR